jgi:tetratricopeptide (TPR) repeat protein
MDDLRQAIAHADQQAIALHEQGRASEAADTAAWACEYAREHLPPDDDLRRRTTMNAAALAELAGDGETALRFYTEAMDLADALADVATLGQALDRLFAIHRERSEYDAAVRAGERSLALWRARREPPNDIVLTFMNNLAQMHYRAGAAERAATLMEEVIAHRQRVSHEDTPALALALLNLGTVRQSQGDFVSAESHMLSALAMRRRLLPPGDPVIVEALQQLSDLYASQGDYRRAIPYEEETLAATQRRSSEPLDTARVLNNLATAYYRAGEVARSRPLYEEALTSVTRARGAQHPDTAAALGNLANVLRRLGDFDGAQQLLRDVIATRQALLGDLHGDVGVAIDDLTDLFREKQSARDLERFYREVLDIVLRYVDDPAASTPRLLQSLQKIERTHAALAPNRPRSLAQGEADRLKNQTSLGPQVIANLTYHLKEAALAATFFAEACARAPRQTHEWSLAMVGLAASFAKANDLAQADRVCDDYMAAVHAGWQAPADHYASVLRTKSHVQEALHGPSAAIAAMRESVAESRRTQSEAGGVYFAGLLRLSELHLAAGQFDEAADSGRRLLEEPPATIDAVIAARARAVLAHVARHEGRLVEAESLFRAALPPMLAAEPTWRTALLLRDFGLLYTGANNTANGVPLIQRAIAMAQDLHGERSWQYAGMVATLAEVKSVSGPVHEAAPLFAEVAGIANELGSPQLLARALRGSGALYTRMGVSEAAEDLLTKALSAMRQYGASPGERASVEVDLAMTEARMKKYAAACERIDRAITTLREPGVNRTWLANATRTKMWILGYMQRWHEAFDAARDTSDVLEQGLQQPLTIASSRARDEFAGALYRHLDIVLSLAIRLRTSAAVADACERTLRWKGAALTWSASHVQALAASTAVEVKALRHDFIEVRRAIIRRSISGPGATEDGAMTMEELQRREEALDREIARRLSSVPRPDVATPTAVTLQTVAAALPADGALIDYVRYESIDFDRGGPADRFHRGTYRYAAFIVRPGAEPALFDVGDADDIDRGVSRFRAAITGDADRGGIPAYGAWVDDRGEPVPTAGPVMSHDDWIAAGADLRRLVFDPLRDAIESCTRLIIAQHGELTRLPFAALPIDHEYLIDRYELTSLDTGRDLLRSTHHVTTPDAPLVMADPDFDLDLQSVPGDDRLRPFGSLSATREEGAAIAAILDVAPVMGVDAAESRLRSARSPRILHIATHGFFLADDRAPRPANVFDTITMIEIPGYGKFAAQAFDGPRAIEDGPHVDRLTRIGRLPDPLLRSGVALAGSNTWVSGGFLSGGDDGLMTAAEIALLDFTSTDLAVLSACETGLGEVRHGEGVFGLRRAFAIAGVGTLVMSVWKIPDLQTRDLMIEFYRRVAAGESFAQALRAAQRHVRETTPHPLDWAGLLCIGKPAA